MIEIKNQKEFNKNFTKEKKVIRFRDESNFKGQLIVEDYPNLENLYLRSVKSVDKVILKNLDKLQNCTILDCDVKELAIENCPQIKKLNIQQNDLTGLEFLKGLNNLENLEIDGNAKIVSGLEYLPGNWGKFSYENTKLTEVLKFYGNDWKACKKETQEIFELTNKQDFQGLIKKFWDLKKSREELKRDVSGATGHSTASRSINTKELVLNLGKEFKDKEERINYLESRIQELIDLSKQQKDKIINAYLTHFGSEKELAKNLIESYLEFIKFKKKEINSLDYDEKCEKHEDKYKDIKKQLRTRLDKEAMNGVQRILTDCEKLVEQEIELENKSSDVEGQKQKFPQISSDNEEEANHQLKLKLAKTEDQLKVYQEQPVTQQVINYINCNIINVNQYNLYYHQLANETEKEISEPLTSLEVTEQDKQVINQTIIFWGTQELFFNYRKNTIDKLVNCYCRLANKTKVTKKWTTRINSVMGITSKLATSIPSGSIAETPLGIVGDIAALTGIVLEDKYLDKCIKEFKEIISKDSQDLIFFDQSYDSLYKTIWNNNRSLSPITTKIIEVLDLVKEKPYPFSKDQDIYQVSSIRQEYFTNLTSADLKSFLEKLDKNLVEFYQSFEEQKKQLNEQEWFKIIDQQTNLLQEQKIEAQIQVEPK